MTALRPARVFVARLLLIAGVVVLSACGQTGALYLPDEPAEPQPSNAADTANPDAATADHH